MKSYRFSASIESMLKYIAEKDGRSETKELEYLIRKHYSMIKDIEAEGNEYI
ncbi:MAG: TraY domain-containing protein [Clostridiaceae bacterium]|nr:TraY domain-containing protein [Clostridiaceae bacterium]